MLEEIKDYITQYVSNLTPSNQIKEVTEILNQNFGEENVEVLIDAQDVIQKIMNARFYIDSYNFVYFEDIDSVASDLSLENVLEILPPVINNVIVLRVTIKFPKVTVTNEDGQSAYLKNLFVRFFIEQDGTFYAKSITMNKSTYSYAHFTHYYIHSHCTGVHYSNLSAFQSCCLGKGPINNTIDNLLMEYNEEQWMQFCYDLEKYVTIESKEGVPYYSLETCNAEYVYSHPIFFDAWIPNSQNNLKIPKDFILYLLNNKILSFTWQYNHWILVGDLCKISIDITSAFLQWSKEILGTENNRDLINFYRYKDIKFKHYYYHNNKLYSDTSHDFVNISEYEGQHVLTFKDKEYTLEIEPAKYNAPKLIVILQDNIILDTITTLLYYLNAEYYKLNHI